MKEEKEYDVKMETVKPWSGYTLDEIRYQRVLTMARIEMEKVKLASSFQTALHGSKEKGQPAGILSRMFGALNYFDYGLLAFRFGRQVFRTIGRLRK